MLVTCPECGAGISSSANPCPKCGFPKAGYQSKENCEEIAKDYLPGSRIQLDRWNRTEWRGRDYSFSRLIGRVIESRVEKFKKGGGYHVVVRVLCEEADEVAACGEEIIFYPSG